MGHGRPTLPSHLTSGSELPLLGLLKNMSLALQRSWRTSPPELCYTLGKMSGSDWTQHTQGVDWAWKSKCLKF